MTRTPGMPPDQDLLVRYLLGLLPEADTESLDEQSVADDELAARLEEVENELLDRYAAGDLPTELARAVEAQYAGTPHGRQRLRFAAALRTRTAAPRPRSLPPWALLAAAAVLALGIGGALISRMLPVATEDPVEVALSEPKPDVRLPAPTQPETPTETAPQRVAPVLAFTLLSATRGAAPPPAIAIPAGTTEVTFHLVLEADDFAGYEAVLRDPATGRALRRWRALRSRTARDASLVSLTAPAAVLDERYHVVELFGAQAGASPEAISSYPFRVIRNR